MHEFDGLSTVELMLSNVTFTDTTDLYANITSYGTLKIMRSLSVLGYIRSRQGALDIYGQLSCYDYSHVDGNLNLWGALNSPSITVNNSILSVLQIAQIQGHVKVTNSSVVLSAPLFVKGGWESDSTAHIQFGSIIPNSDALLNISTNIALNGTIFYYSINAVPTSTTVYRLFAYHGSLNGTFHVQHVSVPSSMDMALLTLDQSSNVISLVYTPKQHHGISLQNPGPWLWGVLGGIVVFVVLAVLVSLYFIRRRKQRHYEVIING